MPDTGRESKRKNKSVSEVQEKNFPNSFSLALAFP